MTLVWFHSSSSGNALITFDMVESHAIRPPILGRHHLSFLYLCDPSHTVTLALLLRTLGFFDISFARTNRYTGI